MSTYRTHRPRAYAARKADEMVNRWQGEPGLYVRQYGHAIWSTPYESLIAFGANSTGPSEVICSSFCAIGYWNTPTGSRETLANGGAWRAIATSDEFDRLVGRQGHLGPGWERAILDQAVIGMIDYRNGIGNVRGIPEDLRPTTLGSQWAWACGVFGYVTATGAIQAINAHADFLRGYDESRRFGALLAAVAEAGFTRTTAYPLVRAWQRLECGRALAERTGGDLAWFDLGLGQYIDAVEHRITVAYYGEPDVPTQPGAYGPVGTEMPGGTNWLLVLGAAALAGYAVKKALEGRKRGRRRRW